MRRKIIEFPKFEFPDESYAWAALKACASAGRYGWGISYLLMDVPDVGGLRQRTLDYLCTVNLLEYKRWKTRVPKYVLTKYGAAYVLQRIDAEETAERLAKRFGSTRI